MLNIKDLKVYQEVFVSSSGLVITKHIKEIFKERQCLRLSPAELDTWHIDFVYLIKEEAEKEAREYKEKIKNADLFNILILNTQENNKCRGYSREEIDRDVPKAVKSGYDFFVNLIDKEFPGKRKEVIFAYENFQKMGELIGYVDSYYFIDRLKKEIDTK